MNNFINKEKTEITICGDAYVIDNIELIYTQNNYLYLCVGCQVVRCLCKNSAKTFNEIATQILLSGKDNFVVLLTGNNLVNVNKIKTIKLDDFDLIIETKNHLYTLKNANCMEYMCLKGKLLKDNNQNLSK